MFSATQTSQFTSAAPCKQVAVVYGLFAAIAGGVYYFVAGCEFSCIQTLAGMLQCLAMAFLMQQTFCSKVTEGISSSSLLLHAAAFACRLSSTTWLNGYLPVDVSGDFIYQAFDVLALLLALRLIREFPSTGASGKGCGAVICISIGLAALLHADMNKRPLFDTLWMASVFLASAGMVAQMFALRKLPSSADPLAGHALSAMAMAQILSAIYMWHARNDMSCACWLQGFNHSTWALLIAHAIPVLLACDLAQELSDIA